MRKIASLMVLLLLGVMAFAQQTKTISGRSRTKKARPLPLQTSLKKAPRIRSADAKSLF